MLRAQPVRTFNSSYAAGLGATHGGRAFVGTCYIRLKSLRPAQ